MIHHESNQSLNDTPIGTSLIIEWCVYPDDDTDWSGWLRVLLNKDYIGGVYA